MAQAISNKPQAIISQVLGSTVRVTADAGRLTIELEEVWTGKRPPMSVALRDIMRLRAAPAGRLVDGRAAASLWIDVHGEVPTRMLVKWGEADAVKKLAEEIEVIAGLRARPVHREVPKTMRGVRRLPAEAIGEVELEVQDRARARGGVIAVGKRGLRFKTEGESGRWWPVDRLFGVEARRFRKRGNDNRWHLSIRLIDGRRDAILEGQDMFALRWIAEELNQALGVPSASERIRAALDERLHELAPAEAPLALSGDRPVLPYAPDPTDKPVYQRNAEGLRIVLPRISWQWDRLALGTLVALALITALAWTRARVFSFVAAAVWAAYALLRIIHYQPRVSINVDAEGVQVFREYAWRRDVFRIRSDEIADVEAGGEPGSFVSDLYVRLTSDEAKFIGGVVGSSAGEQVARRMRVALGLPEGQV